MSTDSQPPASIVLGPKEYSRAGGVLGRAFYDDPEWVALMPDADVRRERLPMMFAGTVKLTADARGVPERTKGFEAVALWLAPGRDLGLWPQLRSGIATARWVVRLPFRDVRRMLSVLRQFDSRRKELMANPHWYLMALGVDPAHQGQGHGSALVRSGIQRADRDGRQIYLETESDINVGFYEALGFEVAGEMTIEQIDLPFSLMIRNPEARSTS